MKQSILVTLREELTHLAEVTKMSDSARDYHGARQSILEYHRLARDTNNPVLVHTTPVDPIERMSDSASSERMARRSQFESDSELERVAIWVRRVAHVNYIASVQGALEAGKAAYKAKYKVARRPKRMAVQDRSMADIESAMLDCVQPIDTAIEQVGNPLDFGQYDGKVTRKGSNNAGMVVLAKLGNDWKPVRTSPTEKGAAMQAKMYVSSHNGVQTHIASRIEAARIKFDALFSDNPVAE